MPLLGPNQINKGLSHYIGFIARRGQVAVIRDGRLEFYCRSRIRYFQCYLLRGMVGHLIKGTGLEIIFFVIVQLAE